MFPFLRSSAVLVPVLCVVPAVAEITIVEVNSASGGLNGSHVGLIENAGTGELSIDIADESGTRNYFDFDGNASNASLRTFTSVIPFSAPVTGIGNDLPQNRMIYYDGSTDVNGTTQRINYFAMSEGYGPAAVVNAVFQYDFGPDLSDASDDLILRYAIEDSGAAIDFEEAYLALGARVFTDRTAWEAAGGSASITEDFEGFGSLTPFDSPLDLAGEMTIRQLGDSPDPFSNLVFIETGGSRPSTPPGSSPSNYAYAVTALGGPDTEVEIRLCRPVSAWGADFGDLNRNGNVILELYSGSNLISRIDPEVEDSFLGFVAAPSIAIDRIVFRTDESGTAGFGIDNISQTEIPITRYAFTAQLTSSFVDVAPPAGSINALINDQSITTISGTFSHATEQNVLIENGNSHRFGNGTLKIDEFDGILPTSVGDLILQNFSFLDGVNQFRGYEDSQTVFVNFFNDPGDLFTSLDMPEDLPLGAFDSVTITCRVFTGSGEFEETTSEFVFTMDSLRQIEGPHAGKNTRLGIELDETNVTLTPMDVPAGLNFHLRGSVDLGSFGPFFPVEDFTSETAAPIVLSRDGWARFFRIEGGVSPVQ